MKVLGIDIGGSGIKGAPVNVDTGELLADRFRIPTPQPSTPGAVADAVAKIVRTFDWQGPVGCTFPAVVKRGVVYSAANVDDSWIRVDADALFEARTGCPVMMLNDADAAGTAEMIFGAGRNRGGTVFVLTLGTGIGSAIFADGKLVPNTELGHIHLRCRKRGAVEAEDYASDRVRQAEKLSWTRWALRLGEYLKLLEALFSPDLFIVGGGVSRKHDRFLPLLKIQTEIVAAELLNEAGIVGAALAAGKLGPHS